MKQGHGYLNKFQMRCKVLLWNYGTLFPVRVSIFLTYVHFLLNMSGKFMPNSFRFLSSPIRVKAVYFLQKKEANNYISLNSWHTLSTTYLGPWTNYHIEITFSQALLFWNHMTATNLANAILFGLSDFYFKSRA